MKDLDLDFKPKLNALSEEQLRRIHMATLELLERTGVHISHPGAVEKLADAGARVDKHRVRIPAWMVDKALQKSPSRVALGKRNGERSVILEGDRSWFGPNVDCMDYLVPFTGERRRFTIEDCRTTATILDALPNYDWGMTFGLADDVLPELADRLVVREAFKYSEKPLVFCCNDVNSLRDIYEMALLLTGSESRFLKAPTVVLLIDPISPLVHPDENIEKMIFCAEKGIPQICCGAPQSGSTAPATFAGTIVQGSAESLSGLVIAQLIREGAPFIYGAFATVMDMRTTIFSYGAPEMSLMSTAMAQMAQFYDLPVFGTAGCSDAKLPDSQSAAEATYSCYASALSGGNLIHDCGLLDHGSLVSPAFMVLVNEVLDMVTQFVRGIQVNDETLALDVIDQIGPGGHFIEEDHTLKHFREVWYSDLFDRSIHDVWLEQGGRRFEERLRERTLEVMGHEPPELPSAVVKELDQMAQNWK
ncbi:MAG: trimethylamine methyltransferase family protein [Desulfobacteraceae bacterium]